MFAKASLKTKLMCMCAALALLPVILGAVNKILVTSMSAAYSHVDRVILQDYVQLALMRASANRARLAVTELGLEGISAEVTDAARKSLAERIATYDSADKIYSEVPFAPGEKEIYNKLSKTWGEFKEQLLRGDELSRSSTPEDHRKLVELAIGPLDVLGVRFNDDMGTLLEFQDKEADAWIGKAEALASQSVWAGAGLGALAMLVALMLGYFVSRSLASALSLLSERLATATNAVAQTAKQIATASAESSDSLTGTAAALQETVAAIDQVNAMVGKNAGNAKRSFEASNVSKQAADRGKVAVGEMLQSIADISRSNAEIMAQTEASNVEISSIVKIIAEIGTKTKVINDIVFQTKLLSFNASVEAARAGEHGKGFAVVAEEVGNLAQMSGNAAKDISTMLAESIQKVEQTVAASKGKIERMIVAGRDKIDTGTVTARRCGEALDEIVRNVDELNHMVNEISTASREQSQGVQEITKALSQIDQGMQKSSDMASQLAHTGDALTHHAEALDGLVHRLVKTVHGDENHAPQVRTGPSAALPPSAVVRPMHRPVAAKKPARAALHRVGKAPQSSARSPAKIAVNDAIGGSLPAENDPRFEDV